MTYTVTRVMVPAALISVTKLGDNGVALSYQVDPYVRVNSPSRDTVVIEFDNRP